jgi:hypothetical protein
MDDGPAPVEGDLSICAKCLSLATFGPGNTLIAVDDMSLTDEDMGAVWRMREFLQTAQNRTVC